MIITALEIRQKTFVKSFRGYEKEEVDTFLNSLSQEWEKMVEQNKEFKRKSELAEQEMQKLKSVESSLFKTLKTAEEASSNIISNAEITANAKIDEANKIAQIKIDDATKTAAAILDEAMSKSEEIIQDAEKTSRKSLDHLDAKVLALQKEVIELEAQKNDILKMLGNIVNATNGALGVVENTVATKNNITVEITSNSNETSFFEEIEKEEQSEIEIILSEANNISDETPIQEITLSETPNDLQPKGELGLDNETTILVVNEESVIKPEIENIEEKIEETTTIAAEVEIKNTVQSVDNSIISNEKTNTRDNKKYNTFVLVDKTDEEPKPSKTVQFENSSIQEDVSFFDLIK